MQRLHFTARIAAPSERVFALFEDHQQFTKLFGSACVRRHDARGGNPNGLGSVRTIGEGWLAFDETIIRFEPPHHIHYQITRGSPLKNHLGQITLTQSEGQTLLDYRIEFAGRLPLIDWLVARMLRRQWQTIALPKLEKLGR